MKNRTIVFAGIVCILGLTSCSTQLPSNDGQPIANTPVLKTAPPNTPKLKTGSIEITSDSQVAAELNVSIFTNGNQSTDDSQSKQLPFKTQFTYSDASAHWNVISVQATSAPTAKTITCKIIMNGQTRSLKTTVGSGQQVACNVTDISKGPK